MKLILLYGAPATGKYTIATKLAQKTGYSFLHNHAILNPLSEIFGFDHPARKRLEKEFRVRIVEEAVSANINIILTGVIMRDNEGFYRKLLQIVDEAKNELFLVHLTASQDELHKRITNDSRKSLNKLVSQEKLKDWLEKYPESLTKLEYKKHLTIDTTKIAPDDVVEQISKLSIFTE